LLLSPVYTNMWELSIGNVEQVRMMFDSWSWSGKIGARAMFICHR
jgi:hypothetical protein